MDLEYLKRGARQFSYQLRKFYPEDESPINHYVCKNHVLVLSTKRLFIYYYDRFIDYTGDFFMGIDITFEEGNQLLVTIKAKTFKIEFEQEKDRISFEKYYLKYSN